MLFSYRDEHAGPVFWNNISPVALSILQLKLPNGNYYIPSSPTGTYSTATFIGPSIYSEGQYLGNVDYLLSAKRTLSARYFYSTEHQSQGFNCLISPNTCLPRPEMSRRAS